MASGRSGSTVAGPRVTPIETEAIVAWAAARKTGSMQNDLTMEDLASIRDAVPHLDLSAIRSLRRAGFAIVKREPEAAPVPNPTSWNQIPRPMITTIV